MTTIGLYSHHSSLEHDAGAGHPERPERIAAVLTAVEPFDLVQIDSPMATDAQLNLIHDDAYLRSVRQLSQQGGGRIDRDTRVGVLSWEATSRASGGACQAVSDLAAGKISSAYCVARPPGHHASYWGPGTWPDWSPLHPSNGFCLTNHAAAAAAWARKSGAAERIFIFDLDAHHGNGTQAIFYDEPSVLYASIHQYPMYPGTGDVTETGTGAGHLTTVNVPLPGGCGEDAYHDALHEIILPIASKFCPDITIVSAGFDAHHLDPLCGMELRAGAFFRFVRLLLELTPKIVCILEGGYDLDALAWGSVAMVSALAGYSQPRGIPDAEAGIVRGQTAAGRWIERARKAR